MSAYNAVTNYIKLNMTHDEYTTKLSYRFRVQHQQSVITTVKTDHPVSCVASEN